jgi:hypothetical protein
VDTRLLVGEASAADPIAADPIAAGTFDPGEPDDESDEASEGTPEAVAAA